MPLDQEFLNYFAKQSGTTNESNTDNKGDVSQHTVKQKVGGAEGKWEGRKEGRNALPYKGKQIERGFSRGRKGCKDGKALLLPDVSVVLIYSQPFTTTILTSVFDQRTCIFSLLCHYFCISVEVFYSNLKYPYVGLIQQG